MDAYAVGSVSVVVDMFVVVCGAMGADVSIY